MLILEADEVRRLLPMKEAIAGMAAAFGQLARGQALMPLRSRVETAEGVTLFMPAYLAESQNLAVKIVSVFPGNPGRGEPMIYATVLVLDPHTGRVIALLEGASLTAIRTGAVSGLATQLLSRPESSSVAIIGSGAQARTQLEAVCTVRPIQQVWVYSPNLAHAHQFAAEMAGRGPIPAAITVATKASEAVQEADIICTATSATTPVFPGRDLKPGSHINAVGSYTPTMQEVDSDTIRRAFVFVDSHESVWEEAGDLIIPLQAGLISRDHVQAELGQVVIGQHPGRTDPTQITYFKSCGLAIQDGVAAGIVLGNYQL